MLPEVVSLGEPMLEFNAAESGSLRDVRSYQVGYGGDSSNFAIAVSRLGGRAGYLTRLGDDEFGQIFLELWQAEGIDTRHVILEKNGFTGIYFISRREHEHFFTYYRANSAASHLSPADIPADYIAEAKVFHTSGITQAISNSACDATFYAIEAALQAGVLVSYDPNLRLKLWPLYRARAIILHTMSRCNIFLPNIEEARLLTGIEEPEAIATYFLNHGPKIVVLKMGHEGVLLASDDGIYRHPPHPVNLVDSSGAGDTFDGAFIVSYLEGNPLSYCIRFANIAAAITTTGWGAVSPIPRRTEIEAVLNKI